jgi:hypothetical protein
MRPTLLIGISAVLALATLAPSAGADGSPSPPNFSYAGGKLTVAAGSGAHINKDYSWSIKDSGNNNLKSKGDFTFSGGTDKEPASASVALVAGTLKGAYCSPSNCYPFTATCTATGCTMN